MAERAGACTSPRLVGRGRTLLTRPLLRARRYPLALASIHLTAFALDLATSVRALHPLIPFVLATAYRFSALPPFQRDLQLFLLRSVQTRPETTPAASSDAPTKDADLDIEPFLRIASDLLLLFHSHWRQGGFTVMREYLLKDLLCYSAVEDQAYIGPSQGLTTSSSSCRIRANEQVLPSRPPTLDPPRHPGRAGARMGDVG